MFLVLSIDGVTLLRRVPPPRRSIRQPAEPRFLQLHRRRSARQTEKHHELPKGGMNLREAAPVKTGTAACNRPGDDA